jgi:trk system potassium uptake protein TrkA
LGIKNCDVAIVAIGNDFENSVLATSLLKSMGIKKIVAKALNERNAEILYKIGADQVVLPETEMGMRVARALTETDILDRIYISDKHSIIELPPLTKWLSKTIAQLDLRGKFGITILAIKRNDEIMVSPLPIEIIQEHDVCVLLGENTGFEKLKNS